LATLLNAPQPKAQTLPAVAMYLTLTIQLSCATSNINMVSPLTTCTEEEGHAAIMFLWAEGVTGVEIHCRMSAQYGDCFAIEMFKSC
jgi:hypothetical protein